MWRWFAERTTTIRHLPPAIVTRAGGLFIALWINFRHDFPWVMFPLTGNLLRDDEYIEQPDIFEQPEFFEQQVGSVVSRLCGTGAGGALGHASRQP